MFRKLVARILKSLLSKVESKKEVVFVEQYCTITTTNTNTKGVKVHDTHEKRNTDVSTMDNRELQNFVNESVEQIHAELLVKGYKELESILDQHITQAIQTFVIGQLTSLGQYDPEKDNLDGVSRTVLIKMAKKLNLQQYVMRMQEQGKEVNIKPTEAQLKAIVDLSKKAKVKYIEPEDKFEASEMIESLKKRLGENPDKVSQAQINAINSICKKIGTELAVDVVSMDRKSASELIQNLQNEMKDKGISTVSLASDKQVDYVKRLLTMQKKRWTAKREEQFKAMSREDISKWIKTQEEACKAQGLINDNASEGQVNYILSLGKRLRKNYKPDEVKALHKDKASEIIETLQREYLYNLYLGNGHKIDKAEIKIMSLVTVRQLIDQLERERKTNLYEKTANDYTSTQQCL